MSTESIRELLDLTAVHGFYKALLEGYLGHPVPVPMERLTDAARNPVDHSLTVLRRWLRVLDMAISPLMVRDALPELSGHETCEALLRYCVLKSSIADADRDKTDFVATWLYRNPPPSSKRSGKFVRAEAHDAYYFFAQQALEFETELLGVLGDVPQPNLPEEHRQLLREFEFVYTEVEDLRTFDQLMDCGVMQKVRDIKQAFGKSFYHPDVLSLLAAYNVYFGSRFDELFREATRQIKSFAERVQQEGASIMSRVDGDVIVKHLTEVEEGSMLRAEYTRAQENFRKVSRLKKAVDSRRARPTPGSPAPPPPPPPPKITAPPAAAAAPAMSKKTGPVAEPIAESVVTGRGLGSSIEDSRVRGMIEAISNFVRAADPRAAGVVPLRQGNVTLSPAEVEAFRADFLEEKSFRGDYIRSIMEMTAIVARMSLELNEFRAKQNSSYLWKPHADSLANLLAIATRVISESAPLLQTAQQRGLGDKVGALNLSMEKLRTFSHQVATALQSLNGEEGRY